MDREEWDKALILLHKAQILIDQTKFKKDRLIIVIIFHNTALWHQMLGALEEAALFLETAVLNLEILSLMPEFQSPSIKNHIIYLEGLLRMQLWALFSQLHRHREGLYHSQISVRISHYLIRDIFYYSDAMKIRDIIESMERVEEGQNFDLSNSTFLSILQRSYIAIMPVIKEIYRRLVKEEGAAEELESNAEKYINSDDGTPKLSRAYKNKDPNKVDMKNVLGFLNQNLYHDYMNITNIMKLKRLDFRDIYGWRSTDLILTRENLVERLILLVSSYFWIGTELRFLKQMNVEGFKENKDAEFWHGKAVELAVNFLPSNAPLVKHIVTSYQKHHSPWNEKIPEDTEVSDDIQLFKAQNGIFSNKYSPVVKRVKDTSIKLTILDITPNDYLADIFEEKDENLELRHLNKSDSQQLIVNDDKDNEYDDSSYNKKNNLKQLIKNSNNIISESTNGEGKFSLQTEDASK